LKSKQKEKMNSAEKILVSLMKEYSKPNIKALVLGNQRVDFLKEIKNQFRFQLYKNILYETELEGLNQNRIYHFPCDEIDLIGKRFQLVFAKQMIQNVQCFQHFLNHLYLILTFDGVFILVDQFDLISDEVPLELGLEYLISLSSIADYEILKSGIHEQYFYIIEIGIGF